MTTRRVALLRLGRPTAMGEARRCQTWRTLFEALGAEVREIALIPPGPRRPHVGAADAGALLRGEMVLEAFAWQERRAARLLDEFDPQLTVFVTDRTYRPSLVRHGGDPVLDFVDELSASYADRATVSRRRAAGMAFRAMARLHRRFERAPRPARRVAAGFTDSQRLDANWLPILVRPPAERHRERHPSADLLFLGNLSYPPNVDAVRVLDELWPRFPPATTLVLAGRAPNGEVRSTARRRGWSLIEDFAELEDLRNIARIAVAPLRFTAGIQMKVLDVATLDMAQVVTPASVRGFEPGLPVRQADVGQPFVDAVLELLAQPSARSAMAAAAAAHVLGGYTVDRWLPFADELLRSSDRS